MGRYDLKLASKSHSDKPLLCISERSTYRATAVLSQTFFQFVWLKVVYTRDPTEELRSELRIGRSLIVPRMLHCVRILQANIKRYGSRNWAGLRWRPVLKVWK